MSPVVEGAEEGLLRSSASGYTLIGTASAHIHRDLPPMVVLESFEVLVATLA